MKRFTLRPDQKAAIEKTKKEAEQAAVPVEETLAIEIMVPEEKPEPVEAKQEETVVAEPIPAKVTEEPAVEEAKEEPIIEEVKAHKGHETINDFGDKN